MRAVRFLLALVSVLLIVAGWVWLWGQGSQFMDSPSKPAQGGQASICLCEDDETPHQTPLISVGDRALMMRLLQAGTRLIEQDEVVPISELLGAGDSWQCWLELPDAASNRLDQPQLYAHARSSVVIVAGFYKCKKCGHWHATTATGFAITKDGAVVTNYHVVKTTSRFTVLVMTSDGRVFPVKKLLAVDADNDLAVLQVAADDLSPLPIAESREPAPIGTPVHVISHPASHYYYYSSGVVSRHMKMARSNRILDAIEITADFARGSSGAPVLNDQGQVVAIARSTDSLYYREQEGRQENLQMVFKDCVPSHCLLRLIEAPAPEPESTGLDDARAKGESAAKGAEPQAIASLDFR